MAQVRRPLNSEAARGRYGDQVFTHGSGGESIARKFVQPSNPKSPLQQAQRKKMASASAMFLKDYDDYATVLTGVNLATRNAYLAAVSVYKQAHPVTAKKFANGFESGNVPQRAYAIKHVLAADVLIAKRESDGNMENNGSIAIKILPFDVNGGKLAEVALNAGANGALPAGTVAVVVAKSTVTTTGITSIATLTSAGGLTANMSELIDAAKIGYVRDTI